MPSPTDLQNWTCGLCGHQWANISFEDVFATLKSHTTDRHSVTPALRGPTNDWLFVSSPV